MAVEGVAAAAALLAARFKAPRLPHSLRCSGVASAMENFFLGGVVSGGVEGDGSGAGVGVGVAD